VSHNNAVAARLRAAKIRRNLELGLNLSAEDAFWLLEQVERHQESRVRRGRLGSQARLANLTPERRSEIARNAARARWDR
jgi:hypothetical protein